MQAITDCISERGTPMPIALGTLGASSMLAFDLYLQGEKSDRLVLYRQRSHPFEQADLDRLAERGIRTLYILSDDLESYREHLRESVLKNDDVPAAQRYQALCAATRDMLSDALTSGNPDTAVATTKAVSSEIVRTVCESSLILNELLRSMSHDYSSFTHAMNVATYCLVLAQKLGISDEMELLQIAQGALLHDIGMQYVPRQILQKATNLTLRERQIVEAHVTHGFLELCRRDDLTVGQLMMVYGHHERCTGDGYPIGLVGSEIHVYARLCAIVDTYAALTSDRPHRRAHRRSYALKHLERQAGNAFDKEMTRCWISVIESGK